MSQKKALVLGCTGQDGSYMAELLLEKGYQVCGGVRRSSIYPKNLDRIRHIQNDIIIKDVDLLDMPSIVNAIKEFRPHEIYNFAAVSNVARSWAEPLLTMDINCKGVMRILEAIKLIDRTIKFWQASTSEQFGKVTESPQNENTPFHPRSPYAVSKVTAHLTVQNYRESYDMFACSGISFNHESEKRTTEFVTQKVIEGAAKIKLGFANELSLGNLDAKRDWGYAKDYVKAYYLMLQQDIPEDFVIATGETHSVRELVKLAFKYFNLDWQQYIKLDLNMIRPAEVDLLLGDFSKAKKKLGWQPEISFYELIAMMAYAAYEKFKK